MATQRVKIKAWYFASESDVKKNKPNPKQHETLKFADGSLSCDCPGWKFKVAADGSRTCRHVRLVQAGLADGQATRVLNLVGTPQSETITETVVETSQGKYSQKVRKLVF
jgi:hypothetical protein